MVYQNAHTTTLTKENHQISSFHWNVLSTQNKSYRLLLDIIWRGAHLKLCAYYANHDKS